MDGPREFTVRMTMSKPATMSVTNLYNDAAFMTELKAGLQKTLGLSQSKYISFTGVHDMTPPKLGASSRQLRELSPEENFSREVAKAEQYLGEDADGRALGAAAAPAAASGADTYACKKESPAANAHLRGLGAAAAPAAAASGTCAVYPASRRELAAAAAPTCDGTTQTACTGSASAATGGGCKWTAAAAGAAVATCTGATQIACTGDASEAKGNGCEWAKTAALYTTKGSGDCTQLPKHTTDTFTYTPYQYPVAPPLYSKLVTWEVDFECAALVSHDWYV